MKSPPDYLRVYNELHRRLASQEWSIGAQIPSIADLQNAYGIRSLGSVRQAQQRLVEQGFLRTEQGRGAFVVAYPQPLPQEGRIAMAMTAIDEAMELLVRARRALASD